MGQYDETPNVRECRDLLRSEAGRAEARRVLTEKIGKLTANEKLIIWRRSENLSQKEAAKALSVSWRKYGEYERSAEKCEIFLAEPREIPLYDLCFILRKRKKLSIPEVAKKSGVSRYWYNQMELGKVQTDSLVEYWINYER